MKEFEKWFEKTKAPVYAPYNVSKPAAQDGWRAALRWVRSQHLSGTEENGSQSTSNILPHGLIEKELEDK